MNFDDILRMIASENLEKVSALLAEDPQYADLNEMRQLEYNRLLSLISEEAAAAAQNFEESMQYVHDSAQLFSYKRGLQDGMSFMMSVFIR